MEFTLASGTAVLARTPAVLDALLRGLPRPWTRADEGPETWSAFDVVGHLIHGEETDWIPRARIILEHGEARPFEPFDRFAQMRADRDASLDGLLDRFAALRRGNLAALAAWDLGPRELARTGTHPELGRVTLRQLLATWVVHDLAHLRQIARVMAKALGAETGPWTAYLPVLGEGRSGGG